MFPKLSSYSIWYYDYWENLALSLFGLKQSLRMLSALGFQRIPGHSTSICL